MLKLRNGSEMAEPIVIVLYRSLEILMKQDPIGLYELVMKSRDPNHKIWGSYQQKLADRGLIDPDGTVKDQVKDIVLSSVIGEDAQMTLISPLLEKPEPKKLVEIPQDQDALKTYYETVQDIGEFILDVMGQNGVNVFDIRLHTSEPNPFYDRIPFNGGIALVYSYGFPSSFMTPLGSIEIRGSLSSGPETDLENLQKVLTENLGLMEGLVYKENNSGCHGPVYIITQGLDGKEIPQADLTGMRVEAMANYSPATDYGEAKALWRKVSPKAGPEVPQ